MGQLNWANKSETTIRRIIKTFGEVRPPVYTILICTSIDDSWITNKQPRMDFCWIPENNVSTDGKNEARFQRLSCMLIVLHLFQNILYVLETFRNINHFWGGMGGRKRGWQILKDVAYSSEVINNLTCIMFENTWCKLTIEIDLISYWWFNCEHILVFYATNNVSMIH